MDNPIIIKINNSEIKNSDILIELKVNGNYKDAFQDVLKQFAIKDYAAKNNIEVTQDQLSESVSLKRKELNILSVDETKKYLGQLGVTFDQWVDYLEFEKLNEIVKNNIITDSRVEKYFLENKNLYIKISLLKIVVNERNIAEEIFLELRDDKEDFQQLAIKYSDDIETSDIGGYMGKIKRGKLPIQIEQKVFTADEGDIIGPIEMNNEFEIYKVNKILMPELNDELKTEIKESLYKMWVSTLLQSCKLESPKS